MYVVLLPPTSSSQIDGGDGFHEIPGYTILNGSLTITKA